MVRVLSAALLTVAMAACTSVPQQAPILFASSAQVYFAHTAVRLKTLALFGAGLNMALFQLVTARDLATWDRRTPAPRAARVAGLLSVLLWAAVVLLGRWIGFTKGYDFTIPPGVELGFPIGPE